MKHQESPSRIFNLMLIALLLTACGGGASTATTIPALPTHTPIPQTLTLEPPTVTPVPPTPTPEAPTATPTTSSGNLVGTVERPEFGTSLILAYVNEIQSDGTFSLTLAADLILPSAQGEFTIEDIPPGQYVVSNIMVIIGAVEAKGEMRASAGPFSWIEYAEAVGLPTESFVFADTKGKPGSGFLYADDKVIVFTIAAGQTLEIEKPIFAE